jgi:hypothetical protein
MSWSSSRSVCSAPACPNPSPKNSVLNMCCDKLYREAFRSAGASSRFFDGRASCHLESAGKPARSKRFATKAGTCGCLARFFSRKDEGLPALSRRKGVRPRKKREQAPALQTLRDKVRTPDF